MTILLSNQQDSVVIKGNSTSQGVTSPTPVAAHTLCPNGCRGARPRNGISVLERAPSVKRNVNTSSSTGSPLTNNVEADDNSNPPGLLLFDAQDPENDSGECITCYLGEPDEGHGMDQSGVGENDLGAAAPGTSQMNKSQGRVNIKNTLPDHSPISCPHRPCILSLTSSRSLKSWRWASELSALRIFLHNFWRYFKWYPAMKALSYLRKCVPPAYFREINTASHLNEALSNLSLWTEDNSGLSRHINRSLRAIPTSNDIWDDRTILKRQITLVK